MKLAEGQATLRGTILLLELWALLGPVQCSHGHPMWRYISSEVVIPRKQMYHGKSIPVLGWVSYSLKFSGQRHVIHMQLKKLLRPRYLPVVTQDNQGALQTDYPYVPRDCYYIGYLEDIPYSLVTVDTCYGGIEGIMKLDDLAYEIKPLKDSHRFEHIISQIVADENAMEPGYKLGTKEEIDSLFSAENISATPRISTRHFASHELNIHGLPQCSHSMYSTINNFTKSVEYMIGYTSLVDSYLWGIHMRYYIYGLLIYNERDPAVMTPYNVPGSPFYTFYANNIYKKLTHMSSFVLIKDGPEDYAFTPKSAICRPDNLLFIGHLRRHYILLSTITAQHVGISLGIAYDEEFCICQRRTTCIMQKYPLYTDAFSNCSFNAMRNIDSFGPYCLALDPVSFYNETLTRSRCGNGIVEDKEQCDCGSFKKCYDNPCCKNDCTLTPGSRCDVGLCCTNCTYSPTGTLCRPMRNICDLPEYCFGNSYTCPADFYMQDGTPCTEKSYCFRGNCTDYDLHCKDIFGKDAIKAPDICYTLNAKGTRFGHCWRKKPDQQVYEKCSKQDLGCGRLQCTNVTHLPLLQEHVAFHHTTMNGTDCFGVDEHRRTGTNDVGKIRTGSICAEGSYCNFVFCNGSVKDIKYDCVPQKCNYKGICNNQKNCHCHIGWDPPNCQKRGAGGSVNSGPPPRKMRSVTQRIDTVIYLRVVYGRIYALIFAFLIGLATNVRNIKTVKITEMEKGPENAKE